jgi:hypothetical protein
MRFEVITAVFWGVMSCSLVCEYLSLYEIWYSHRCNYKGYCLLGCDIIRLADRNQRFTGTCCLHLQDRMFISRPRFEAGTSVIWCRNAAFSTLPSSELPTELWKTYCHALGDRRRGIGLSTGFIVHFNQLLQQSISVLQPPTLWAPDSISSFLSWLHSRCRSH